MSDMGWTSYERQEELRYQKIEEDKCITMRRAFGLVVSNNVAEDFDCGECEIQNKCEDR